MLDATLSAGPMLTPVQGLFNVTPIQPSGGVRGNAAWAGLVGLLNDTRFRVGLPSMGFMNPWLYKYGVHGLTDITLGGSTGCTGRNLEHQHDIPGARIIPYVSWNATEGWDPAPGWGFRTLRNCCVCLWMSIEVPTGVPTNSLADRGIAIIQNVITGEKCSMIEPLSFSTPVLRSIFEENERLLCAKGLVNDLSCLLDEF